ncbi:MAG TPA: Flp family type IVb pilin [Allosphingosinicella sp.]|jgi:pilus assembly protein Flp/PilA
MRRIRDIRSDQSGATAVEYGLILALIFLAMVSAIVGFGQGAIGLWNHVSEQVSTS